MTTHPIKLGLALLGQGPVSEMIDQNRRAESIGFEVILLPDHSLGFTAPRCGSVAIARAAPTVQVSNLVLNAAFYRPALLAGDLASVDSATGGAAHRLVGHRLCGRRIRCRRPAVTSPGERCDG